MCLNSKKYGESIPSLMINSKKLHSTELQEQRQKLFLTCDFHFLFQIKKGIARGEVNTGYMQVRQEADFFGHISYSRKKKAREIKEMIR